MDYRNSIREMLTAWTDKFGREATWDKIVAALRKMGNNVLTERTNGGKVHSTNKTNS